MSTCGYVCPACEGKGFLDNGTQCDWCNPIVVKTTSKFCPELLGKHRILFYR